ncbi:MAG: esterase/lipase family protein [Woeseia sp.]
MRYKLRRILIAAGGPVVILALLGACATTTRTVLVPSADSRDCVVLMHGLNRSYRAMSKMAKGLQEAGFSTANVDYPSQLGPIEELAPIVVNEGLEKCRATNPEQVHFVTHSIAGILLRYAHNESRIPDLGRVVMLAPPNQGSELVDKTKHWPGAELISGKAGLQLGTDEQSIPAQLGPVDFELGVVAGTGTMSFFSAMLPNPDDGKVSVAETEVEGMDDFLVVKKSHHYIMTSDKVIENTEAFLRTGKFPDSMAATSSVLSPQ